MAGRMPTAAVAAASVFVAVEAFHLAYAGSRGAALDMGVPAGSAGSYPWCIEGVIVVASTATLALPRGERLLAWLVLLGFTGISMAANVLHSLDAAGHKVWSPYFAVVPPLALPLCVRLAERVALSTLHRTETAGGRAALAPAGPDSAGLVTPPGRASGDRVDAAAGPSSTPPSADSLLAAVDGGRVDAPAGVRPPTPGPSAERGADAEPDGPPDTAPDVRADGGFGVRPDADRTHRTAPRRTRGGRPAKVRPGRPAGHSPDRTFPDWRTSDWSAVAQDRGISRTRAYEVIAADPAAPQAARQRLAAASAPLNGHAP